MECTSFGLGAPIGVVNRALNRIFGNDHHTESVTELEIGVSWNLVPTPSFVAAVADFVKFNTKAHIVPEG